MSLVAHERDYSTPQEYDTPAYEFPFEGNGDYTTFVVTRKFKQFRQNFIASRLAGQYRAGVDFDAVHRDAVLIATSEPGQTITGLFAFTRTFARVPLTQVVPSSRGVAKPDLTGPFPKTVGDVVVDQPNPDVPSYVFYTHKLVTSDSGAPDGSHPTGGTYPIALGANTASGIAYNAVASAVQAALTALPSISNRGSIGVTGDYLAGFTASIAPYVAPLIDITNLTGTYTPTKSITLQTGFSWLIQIGNQASGGGFTGGTYDFTLFGQTVALHFDDSAATIKAAIEGLSNVGSGAVTISVMSAAPLSGSPYSNAGHGIIKYIVAIAKPTPSISGASLTPAGSAATIDLHDFGYGIFYYHLTGSAAPQRVIYAASHGITAADNIIVTVDATTISLASGLFTVVDANTISFTATAGTAIFNGVAITAVGKQNGQTYEAESVNVPVNLVTTFYLPGVTAGITTTEDIPIPHRTSSGTSLLAAIFGGATLINYDVSEITQWRNSPIIMFTVVQLNPQLL